MKPLLVELLCDDLPPLEQEEVAASFRKQLFYLLGKKGLIPAGSSAAGADRAAVSFHTNRRIATIIQEVEGFPLSDIGIIISQAINGTQCRKNMTWGNGELKFIRPIQSVCIVHGDFVYTAEISKELTSIKHTYGLRFWRENLCHITADGYTRQLRNIGPLVRKEERVEDIYEQLDTEAKQDLKLLGEVANMCENPSVIEGKFDEKFDALPRAVIKACLYKHLRAFLGEGRAFFFVAEARPEKVWKAYYERLRSKLERVVNRRLDDLLDLHTEDKAIEPEEHLANLKRISTPEWRGGTTVGDLIDRMKSTAFTYVLPGIPTTKGEAERVMDAIDHIHLSAATALGEEFPQLEGEISAAHCEHLDEVTRNAVKLHLDSSRDGENLFPALSAVSLSMCAVQFGMLADLHGLPQGKKDPDGLRGLADRMVKILIGYPGVNEYEILRLGDKHFPKEELYRRWDFLRSRLSNIEAPSAKKLREAGATELAAKIRLATANTEQPGGIRLSAVFHQYEAMARLALHQRDLFNDITALVRRLRPLAADKLRFNQIAYIYGGVLVPKEGHPIRELCCEGVFSDLDVGVWDAEGYYERLGAFIKPVNSFLDTVKVNDLDEGPQGDTRELLAYVLRLLNRIGDFTKIYG